MAMLPVACNKSREEEQRRVQKGAVDNVNKAAEDIQNEVIPAANQEAREFQDLGKQVGRLVPQSGASSKKSIDTIAVLPFTADGASADRQKLAESFTLTLTVQLSRVPKLKVISAEKINYHRIQGSPPSYPWTTNGLQSLRNLLGATAVLVGKLSEENRGMVLTVQLVDLEANETLLWAEQYKFRELKEGKAEEVQKWREETIQKIADQVAQKLTGGNVPQSAEK
jgi:TolB-like protein